jgi:hypothetical protein
MLEPIAPTEWHPTLVRDRKLESRFRIVQKDFQAGHVSQGLAGLQSLLDLPQDGFLRSETAGMPIGAHRLAGQLLSASPPETLLTYELLYAAEAQRLLDTATRTRDPSLLRDVVRRFFHTPAGFAALDQLSSRALDVGDYSLAAAGFQRLLGEPVHQGRVTRALRVKAALCWQRCGNSSRARQLVADLGSLPITIAGQHLSPHLWFNQLGGTAGLSQGDTRLVGGGVDRNAKPAGTAPAFGYPVGAFLWLTLAVVIWKQSSMRGSKNSSTKDCRWGCRIFPSRWVACLSSGTSKGFERLRVTLDVPSGRFEANRH